MPVELCESVQKCFSAHFGKPSKPSIHSAVLPGLLQVVHVLFAFCIMHACMWCNFAISVRISADGVRWIRMYRTEECAARDEYGP